MARFHASRLGLLLALASVLPYRTGAEDLFSGFTNIANSLFGSTANALGTGVGTAVDGTTGAVSTTAKNVDGAVGNVANTLGSTDGQLGNSIPGAALQDYTGGQIQQPSLVDATSGITSLGNMASGLTSLSGSSLLSASTLSPLGTAATDGSLFSGLSSQDLGSGLSWNFGGTGVTNILVGLFMGYVSGSSDPNSAINVVGDAFVNQDPTILAQAFTNLITSLDLTCAFQMTAAGDSRYGVNMNFRDGKEALNIQFIPKITNSIFKFTGQFPTATAFSYSAFLVSEAGKITHVDTIDGRDITPATGSNPFRDGVSLLNLGGTYEVFASPSGNTTGLNPRNLKNQFAYNKRGVMDAAAVVIVYRIIMDDRIIGQSGWGSVDPPKLSMNPTPILGSSGIFLNIPACRTSDNNDKIRSFVSDQITTVTAAGSVQVKCDYYNVANNFVFFDGAQYFRPPDENHITSCADTTKLSSGSSELVTVIQGVLPSAKQARYVSISLTDLYPPGANIRTITGSSLRDYLRTRSLSPAGNYTIIMAKSRTVLNRCRLTNLPADYFQVFYTGTVSKYPGVVYREIMTENYPESVENVRSACEDVKDCDNPRFFEGAMGKYYPSVAYLDCNTQTGALTYAPVPNTTWPAPDLPTPAPTALWGSLDASGQLGPCAPKGFMNVTSYQGQEIYIDGQLAGKLTQNEKVVSQSVFRGWSAVEATYEKATTTVTNDTTNETSVVTYMTNKIITSPVMANFLPDKVVFGVKVPIVDGSSGFFAQADLCGYERRTGSGWRCAAGISGQNWTKADYDDSTWLPARVQSYAKGCATLGDCTNVASGSQYIWLDSCPGGSLPQSGSLTCRLVVPQKCDLSCLSGSPDKVAARCPDKNKAVGTSLAASPSLYWIYSNGQLVSQDLTTTAEPTQGLINLSSKDSLVTIAVKSVDDTKRATKGYFRGSFSLCGWEVATGVQWKCAKEEPKTDDWKLATFDDSDWPAATIRDNGLLTPKDPPAISTSATWIWGPNPAAMWCRATYANPAYSISGVTATKK